MLPWIIAGVVLLSGAVGVALGAIMTALFGVATAVEFAKLHTDEYGRPDNDDEASRVDALTISALINAAQDVANNEDAAKPLQLGEYTAFVDALMAAEDRFAGWIEWAEGATATKTSLASGGTPC